MDSKYLPYAVIGLAIVGGVVYLNVDFKSRAYTTDEYASHIGDFSQPCELGFNTKDKDGKPMRGFSWDECVYQLQGLPTQEGDCIKKNAKGGSWAYECSLMNK